MKELTQIEEPEEVRRIRQKANDSQINIVKKILKEPEVQDVIKKNINKQTFISGLFMAFLLIGFLEVSQAIKVMIQYTWQFDMIAGIVLILVGGAYMVKQLRNP